MPATAQTLRGLTVGEGLVPALKTMPVTHNFGQVGNDVAIKWSLPSGSSLSATASPDTGKILLLEEDWDTSAAKETVLPGLTFGVTKLDDIRRRFGSNGLGFVSNAETSQAAGMIGVNCYELRHAAGVFVAFVTLLPVPTQTGNLQPSQIKSGHGVLVAIIVAQKSYLQEIWGTQILADPDYKPIDVLGLVAAR
jgi:hypothetical protein